MKTPANLNKGKSNVAEKSGAEKGQAKPPSKATGGPNKDKTRNEEE